MTTQDFIKEAQGYLTLMDDAKFNIIDAIADRAAWAQNVRTAQENYDSIEAAHVFDLMTSDSFVATGKNAEQRSAAKDAEISKFRLTSHEWKVLQGAKKKHADAQSVFEQNEKRFAAIKIQAELSAAILKAMVS